MAANDAFKASVIAQNTEGTAFVYDFGYKQTSAGDAALDCNLWAGYFQTLVQAKMLACLPGTVTIKKYRFACVHGENAGAIGYVFPEDAPSGGMSLAVGTLPSEVAISLKRNTGYGGRRERGRIFWGPVHKDFADETNPDLVTTNADLIALRDLLKAPLMHSAETLEPFILNHAGEDSGHVIVNVQIADVFVHRKSRRFRTGI